MHRDWRAGLSIFGALGSGLRLTLPSVCCILVAITIIDGPLLQRASTVARLASGAPVPLKVAISEELPANSTGVWVPSPGELFAASWYQPIMLGSFLPAYLGYAQSEPILGAVIGCPGRCTLSVRAPYLALESCNSTVYPLNYSMPMTDEETAAFNDADHASPYEATAAFGLGRLFFNIWIGTEMRSTEKVVTRIGLAKNDVTDFATPDCTGNYTLTTCSFQSAVAEYPLVVDGGAVSLATPAIDLPIVAMANNTALGPDSEAWMHVTPNMSFHTSLTGIAAAAATSFYGTWLAVPIDNQKSGFKEDAFLPGPYLYEQLLDYTGWVNNSKTFPGFRDPTRDMMIGMNEM